jgi:pyridoxine 5-phosphate synthase
LIRLSVNINKIATIRNARGGEIPNVVQAALNIQNYGADGITVHPRPDERHITREDVVELRPVVNTEFNIEGYPSDDFLDLVLYIKPEQVTLVPDGPELLTSNAGWDCINHQDFLLQTVRKLKAAGIRVSLFLDPDPEQVHAARDTGTDRIELYTETYASGFPKNAQKAIEPFVRTAEKAIESGLRINAGHDLNLANLHFFAQSIAGLEEVSIGHALISDALYYGLNNAVQMYKNRLRTD